MQIKQKLWRGLIAGLLSLNIAFSNFSPAKAEPISNQRWHVSNHPVYISDGQLYKTTAVEDTATGKPLFHVFDQNYAVMGDSSKELGEYKRIAALAAKIELALDIQEITSLEDEINKALMDSSMLGTIKEGAIKSAPAAAGALTLIAGYYFGHKNLAKIATPIVTGIVYAMVKDYEKGLDLKDELKENIDKGLEDAKEQLRETRKIIAQYNTTKIWTHEEINNFYLIYTNGTINARAMLKFKSMLSSLDLVEVQDILTREKDITKKIGAYFAEENYKKELEEKIEQCKDIVLINKELEKTVCESANAFLKTEEFININDFELMQRLSAFLSTRPKPTSQQAGSPIEITENLPSFLYRITFNPHQTETNYPFIIDCRSTIQQLALGFQLYKIDKKYSPPDILALHRNGIITEPALFICPENRFLYQVKLTQQQKQKFSSPLAVDYTYASGSLNTLFIDNITNHLMAIRQEDDGKKIGVYFINYLVGPNFQDDNGKVRSLIVEIDQSKIDETIFSSEARASLNYRFKLGIDMLIEEYYEEIFY